MDEKTINLIKKLNELEIEIIGVIKKLKEIEDLTPKTDKDL